MCRTPFSLRRRVSRNVSKSRKYRWTPRFRRRSTGTRVCVGWRPTRGEVGYGWSEKGTKEIPLTSIFCTPTHHLKWVLHVYVPRKPHFSTNVLYMNVSSIIHRKKTGPFEESLLSWSWKRDRRKKVHEEFWRVFGSRVQKGNCRERDQSQTPPLARYPLYSHLGPV